MTGTDYYKHCTKCGADGHFARDCVAEATKTATTKNPVTTGGWYEHSDGTVGEYKWIDGQVKLSRSVASWADVPNRDEENAASARAEMAARKAGDVRPD